MNNFTPEQLNRLNRESAELFFEVKVVNRFGHMLKTRRHYEGTVPSEVWPKPIVDKNGNHFKLGDCSSYWYQHAENSEVFCYEWRPTDKNSAQNQNYLIPRLKARGLEVHIFHIGDGVSVEIHRPLTRGSTQMYICADGSCDNDDEINATITQCCILAMKKLKEIDNGIV